jgi:hypothetical protein
MKRTYKSARVLVRRATGPVASHLGPFTAIDEAAKRGKPCWWLKPALPPVWRPRPGVPGRPRSCRASHASFRAR